MYFFSKLLKVICVQKWKFQLEKIKSYHNSQHLAYPAFMHFSLGKKIHDDLMILFQHFIKAYKGIFQDGEELYPSKQFIQSSGIFHSNQSYRK